MNTQEPDFKKNFVCNFNPAEVSKHKLLRVADSLGIKAWVNKPVGGFPDAMGFYVDQKHKDLTQFWASFHNQHDAFT